MNNLPNILTLVRFASSVIFSILLVALLPFGVSWVNYFLAFIFVAICLTDYFDGFFARRLNCETKMGAAFDHIADKFLIISCFLALAYLHKILFISALILILRELFILSVRNFALIKNFSLDVSIWGKFKVASHYLMITVAILNKHTDFSWESSISVLQIILTFVSVALSLYSAYLYFMEFVKKINGLQLN